MASIDELQVRLRELSKRVDALVKDVDNHDDRILELEMDK